MSVDKSKLKALAQKAADLEDQPGLEGEHREAYDELWLHMHCHTILGLLSEIEGLTAQHGRDSAELRKLCAARDSARRERDNLKSEVKALRKDAELLDWLDERSSPVIDGQSIDQPEGELVGYDWSVFGQCSSVRDAIDDAMTREK